MGFFTKKKPEEEKKAEAGQESVSEKAPAKTKKKDKNSMMSSVLRESVVETVLEIFSKNEKFKVQRDGDEFYVAFMLDTADIGGLNKKCRKDEAKGSIIEMMLNGRIQVYITARLMQDERIVIVPTEDTLLNMEEFSILYDAPYQVVLIHKNGGIEILKDRVVSFTEIRRFDTGRISVYDLTGLLDPNAESEDDMDETEEDLDEVSSEQNDFSDYEDYEEEEDESDASDDEPDMDFDQDGDEGNPDVPPAFDEPDMDFDAEEEDAVSDADDTPDEDVSEEADEPDVTYTNADLMREIQRKFYSDELDLEVSTAPFDAQFLHGNVYVPFPEDRPVDNDSVDGFLNQYLNQMAKMANAEMRTLHQSNLRRMRESFMELVSGQVEEIQKQLDYKDLGSLYGSYFVKLNEEKKQSVQDMDRTVAERREALDADYNKKLQEVVDRAAEVARQQYQERFGRQHDEDSQALERLVKDEIENKYSADFRDMNHNRQKEASKRLDWVISGALQIIGEDYAKLLKAENDRYHELSDQMMKYVDENRKDAVARSNALQEKLSRENEVDRLTKEHASKISEMASEFEARRKALETELAEMERTMENKLSKAESEKRDLIQKEQNRYDSLKVQYDELTQKYNTLDERKSKELKEMYDGRIKGLENERDNYRDQYQRAEDTRKRSGKVSAFAMVAVALLMLGVGFIVGSQVGRSNLFLTSQVPQTEITVEANASDVIVP